MPKIIRHAILFIAFPTVLLGRTDQHPLKSDSLNWEISMQVGRVLPQNFTIKNFDAVTSSNFSIRIQRRAFSDFVGFYGHAGLSSIKFEDPKKVLDAYKNELSTFFYGAGLAFSFSTTRFQPSFSFGPGIVVYNRSLFTSGVELSETKGTYFQAGAGLGYMAKNGFGIKFDWNHNWIQHPGDRLNQIEPQTFYMMQLMLGLQQWF